MGEERFYDFDEAIGTVEFKPVPIRLFGTKWLLPPEGDALTIIKLQRLMAVLEEFEREARVNPDRELSDAERARFAEVMDFDWDVALRKLVTDKIADAWYEHGLSVEKLVVVLMLVVSVYGGASPADVKRMGKLFGEALGEARAPSTNGAKPKAKPTKKRSTTSSSSRSSSRTSNASTK